MAHDLEAVRTILCLGINQLEVGHDVLTGTRKALIAGMVRMEVVGTCSLIARLRVHFGRTNHAADGAGEVEVGTLMIMGSPVEMGDLVTIGGQWLASQDSVHTIMLNRWRGPRRGFFLENQ